MRAALPLLLAAAVGCDLPPSPADLKTPSDFSTVFDFGKPDMSAADAAPADLTSTPADLTGSADLAAPPDLKLPPDMVSVPDLRVVPDLRMVPDLSAPPDLSALPDLSVPDDLSMPDDLSVPEDLAMPGGDFAPVNDLTAPKLTFLGNVAAFISSNGTPVSLTGGSVPASETVTVIAQTYPKGSVQAIYVAYQVNGGAFTDILMTFDKEVGNNEQWYAIIPAQPAGSQVKWYVRAVGFDGTTLYHSNFGKNWDYTTF